MPTRNLEYLHPFHTNLLISTINKIKQQSYPKALQLIQKALQIFPNDADSIYLYSVCLYWTGNQQQSKQAQKMAIQMNPLCEIYEMPDKQACQKLQIIYNRALFQQKKISKQTKLTVQSWYNYSITFHEKTNYQRVQQIYQRLFNKYPQVIQTNSQTLLGNYANMLYDLGRYQQAIDKYQIQISRDQQQTRYFSNCSMLYTVVGQYEKAQIYIIQAMTNNDTRKALYFYNYANILAKTNRLDQSIGKLRQALSIEPNDPYYSFKLALNLITKNVKKNEKINTLQLEQIKNKLSSCIQIFEKCIRNNSVNLANANKRMLSMKNVAYLKNYAQLIKQYMLQFISKNIIWDQFLKFPELLADYLLNGQTTKIQISFKILQIFKKQKDKFKSIFSRFCSSEDLPDVLKKFCILNNVEFKQIQTTQEVDYNKNSAQQKQKSENQKQEQRIEQQKKENEKLQFNKSMTELEKLLKNINIDQQIKLIQYIWKWERKLSDLNIRKPTQHQEKWPEIDFGGLFD